MSPGEAWRHTLYLQLMEAAQMLDDWAELSEGDAYLQLMKAALTLDDLALDMIVGPRPGSPAKPALPPMAVTPSRRTGPAAPPLGRTDDYLQQVSRYRKANTEAVQAWRLENCRDYGAERRARLRGAFVANVEPLAIFERDGWTCQLCHEPIDQAFRYPHPKSATVDHIIPLMKGGTHEPGNCQAAHFACNSSKRDRMPLAEHAAAS